MISLNGLSPTLSAHRVIATQSLVMRSSSSSGRIGVIRCNGEVTKCCFLDEFPRATSPVTTFVSSSV